MDNNDNKKEEIDIVEYIIIEEIIKILHDFGIPSHMNGYTYIKESIYLAFVDPLIVNKITKDLYPTIAYMHDTTASSVERCIRHAIDISWNRANWEVMDKLFGHSINMERAKPTNSEFIITISERLRITYNKQ